MEKTDERGLTRKQQKELYAQVKKEVKELEEKNYSRLILFRSGREWFKMGGNSLLIYYFDIAQDKLNDKPTIQPDTDYTDVLFEQGIISFRGGESLEKKLKKAGVFKNVRFAHNNETIIFELNFSLNEEEMIKRRKELHSVQDRAMTILKPTVLLVPLVYDRLRRVQKRTYETVRKMTDVGRDYNGKLIGEYSRMMMKYYLMINNGTITEKEGWQKILDSANMMMIEISFATELGEWRQDVGISIGAEIVEIKREVEKILSGKTVVKPVSEIAYRTVRKAKK